MHAARLGYQDIELVTTGKLALPIAGEPGDWLRAVRRGEVPPAEFYERIEFRDAELGRLNNDEQYRSGLDVEPSTPSPSTSTRPSGRAKIADG